METRLRAVQPLSLVSLFIIRISAYGTAVLLLLNGAKIECGWILVLALETP